MNEKGSKLKILVACHKADSNIRQDNIYMPIQVGKALHPDLDLGFQCDDTGDNISEKNGSYCELTALYWAWKNLKDFDYIGLAHYRRYLDFDCSKISKLGKNSIILPTPGFTPFSNLYHLTEGTTREDVYIFLLYIEKYHPQYYKSAIDYLCNYNGWIGCNMFISDRIIFDNYCTWLFRVLEDLGKYLKPSPYTRLRRIYGYLAEVMLPIYCKSNNLNIEFVPFDINRKDSFKQRLSVIYNRLLFKLLHRKNTRYLKIPEATLVSLKIDNIFNI